MTVMAPRLASKLDCNEGTNTAKELLIEPPTTPSAKHNATSDQDTYELIAAHKVTGRSRDCRRAPSPSPRATEGMNVLKWPTLSAVAQCFKTKDLKNCIQTQGFRFSALPATLLTTLAQVLPLSVSTIMIVSPVLS